MYHVTRFRHITPSTSLFLSRKFAMDAGKEFLISYDFNHDYHDSHNFRFLEFEGKETSYKEAFDSTAKKSIADGIIPHILHL